jgi:hypothetical protein
MFHMVDVGRQPYVFRGATLLPFHHTKQLVLCVRKLSRYTGAPEAKNAHPRQVSTASLVTSRVPPHG